MGRRRPGTSCGTSGLAIVQVTPPKCRACRKRRRQQYNRNYSEMAYRFCYHGPPRRRAVEQLRPLADLAGIIVLVLFLALVTGGIWVPIVLVIGEARKRRQRLAQEKRDIPFRAAQPAGITPSPLEEAFWDFIHRYGLEPPEREYESGVLDQAHDKERAARIDFVWTHLMLAVEVDGRQHEEEPQRSDDKERDRRLREAGWTVLRFRWGPVTSNPDYVAFELKAHGVQRASPVT